MPVVTESKPLKCVIVTNMMAFYRLDLFNILGQKKNISLHVIFSSETEDRTRFWEINKNALQFAYTVLESGKVAKKKSALQEGGNIIIPSGLYRHLKKINPDIIVAGEYNLSALFSLCFARLHKKKYVSWSDGTLSSERNISFLQKILRRFICRFADNFIASGTLTKEAQTAYGADPRKISPALLTIGDSEKFLPSVKKTGKIPRILACSYLYRRKGLHLLLSALPLLKTPFLLDIIGSGDEQENLMLQAEAAGLERQVFFRGYRQRRDIYCFFQEADFFVFPTLLEPFGLVAVEALYAGLPLIISIHAGCIADVLENGINGFAVDPENTAELAEKIGMLLTDNNLRKKMGKASLRISSKFSINKSADDFFRACVLNGDLNA
ncbi:MAG: hypothetical protein A2096_04780 [Spirochaetes bacterium GWF1_41_5]|nr:MAG: hypothetical protein A2096_04780 [Spirochaetes bacterium GWF1_41_5]